MLPVNLIFVNETEDLMMGSEILPLAIALSPSSLNPEYKLELYERYDKIMNSDVGFDKFISIEF